MSRFFMTAGPCNPMRHYMLPAAERIPAVRPLIEQELYFTVHAPRQSGKTTAFRALARQLIAEGKYVALHVSCERGQTGGSNVDVAVAALLDALEASARDSLPTELRPHVPDAAEKRAESRLSWYLENWCRKSPRPVVLFLDEIDALLDDSLVSVLRQLREGYPRRPAAFPVSVALVGLRDVRDYKVRSAVRPESATLGTASPFNIKAMSLTLPDFNAAQVSELLGQHTAETGQRFADDAVAEVFEQSQGQPWLVNALASQLTTSPVALVPDRAVTVTLDRVIQARELLIERRDTHLDSLVDKLREERVRRVLEPVLTGSSVFDPTFDDDFSYVRDLGLVTRRDGDIVLANPIYQEIIPRALSSHVQAGIAVKPAWFVAADGTLDMGKLIEGFLMFWRRHGEILLVGMHYHEAAPHLVFMAWLQRVVNGGGRVEREFAVGTGRADLVTDFGGRHDVIELKLARDRHTLPEGIEQVARYARRLGRDRGYLVIFDGGSTLPWDERGQVEEVKEQGVAVVVVRA